MSRKHFGAKLPESEPLSFPTLEPDAKADSLELFAAASSETLQNIMLTRMSTAANLQKDIAVLIKEVAEQLADAKVAELLLRQKKTRNRNGGPR
jgi:hypothetical protein